MAKNKSSVSKADSYEAIGNFWDEQDFADVDNLAEPDVVFEIQDTVRIEAELLNNLQKVAASQGVSIETLINLWLQEKLHSLAASSSD